MAAVQNVKILIERSGKDRDSRAGSVLLEVFLSIFCRSQSACERLLRRLLARRSGFDDYSSPEPDKWNPLIVLLSREIWCFLWRFRTFGQQAVKH